MGGLRFMDKSTFGHARKPGNRIKVIGAGLPRCATSSLQAALESPTLGFSPCMHMSTVMPHAEHLQTMIDIMVEKDRERRQAMIYKLFDGYESTSDFPGAWFIVDLMDMYPDAVIVLNQRPGGSKKWLPSIRGAFAFFGTWKYRIGCLPILTDRLTYELHGIFWRDLASHHSDQETFRFVTRVLLTRGLVTWGLIGTGAFAASTLGGGMVVRLLSAAYRWKSAFGL